MVTCRGMKTFPCRKSFSFVTTSAWSTQQSSSKCLFKVNRKNKRRPWRMTGGGVIRLKPRTANHNNIKNKQKKHIWKNTGSGPQPDLFSPFHFNSRNFMNGKCQGIGFPKPKPLWPAFVSWAYHAVLLSSWRCDGAEGHRRDRTPAGPLHPNQEASSLYLLLHGWTLWNQDFDNKDCDDLRWSTFKDNVKCFSGATTNSVLTCIDA